MTPPAPQDPFEQRLAAIPMRELPPELRARILASAAKRPRASSFPAFLLSLAKSAFSFPHPLAWGAIAAGWIAIAALNLSGPRGEALYAVTPKDYRGPLPTAQEYLVQMDLQRRLLALLAADTFDLRPVRSLHPQDL